MSESDMEASKRPSADGPGRVKMRSARLDATDWRIVRDCYMLSGEIDFVLKCVAPDLTAVQDFIIHELTAAPNVASVKTSLVIRASKHAAGIPPELAAEGR